MEDYSRFEEMERIAQGPSACALKPDTPLPLAHQLPASLPSHQTHSTLQDQQRAFVRASETPAAPASTSEGAGLPRSCARAGRGTPPRGSESEGYLILTSHRRQSNNRYFLTGFQRISSKFSAKKDLSEEFNNYSSFDSLGFFYLSPFRILQRSASVSSASVVAQAPTQV